MNTRFVFLWLATMVVVGCSGSDGDNPDADAAVAPSDAIAAGDGRADSATSPDAAGIDAPVALVQADGGTPVSTVTATSFTSQTRVSTGTSVVATATSTATTPVLSTTTTIATSTRTQAAATSTATASRTAGSPVPASTGNPVVDALGAAAARCGYQSPRTVPVGWNMTAVGASCSASFPMGWSVSGAGTQMTFMSDPSRPIGTVIGSGVPSGTPGPTVCSARGVADWFLPLFDGLGCSGTKIVHYSDGGLVVVDTTYPVGHSVFTCTYNGTPIVGYMFTMGLPSIFCNIVISSFWEPVAQIDALTCSLSQVLNSQSCPNGGGDSCVDSTCSVSCARNGYSDGKCPTNGGNGCECW